MIAECLRPAQPLTNRRGARIVLLRLLEREACSVKAPPTNERNCCPPADDGPDLRAVEGAAADEELAELAKAVGHPARVQILRLLVRKNACICGEIVEELPLAQSTVSQHLKVLKDAGLIRGDVDGPRVCYCIEPRALRRFKALVGSL